MESTSNNIEMLFVTLAATYGAAWSRSLGTAPISDVKTVWGSQLSGFTMADIRYALDHLPDRCPNILEFRNLCRAAPKKEALRLDLPKADAAVIAAELDKQLGVKQSIAASSYDPKAWARRLVARSNAGDWVRPLSLQFAKQALGMDAK